MILMGKFPAKREEKSKIVLWRMVSPLQCTCSHKHGVPSNHQKCRFKWAPWHTKFTRCGSSDFYLFPLELHLTTSELWFGQEQEEILPKLLFSSFIV